MTNSIEYQRKWKQEHPDYHNNWNKQHPESVRESRRRYRENHKEQCKIARKQYYQKNKEQEIRNATAWQHKNPEKKKASDKKYYLNHKEQYHDNNKKYRHNNREKVNAMDRKYRKKWNKTPKGRVNIKKRNHRRKHELGYIPLNEWEATTPGFVGHHLDKEHVLFIPKELHETSIHKQSDLKSMDIINEKAINWYVDYYGLI